MSTTGSTLVHKFRRFFSAPGDVRSSSLHSPATLPDSVQGLLRLWTLLDDSGLSCSRSPTPLGFVCRSQTTDTPNRWSLLDYKSSGECTASGTKIQLSSPSQCLQNQKAFISRSVTMRTDIATSVNAIGCTEITQNYQCIPQVGLAQRQSVGVGIGTSRVRNSLVPCGFSLRQENQSAWLGGPINWECSSSRVPTTVRPLGAPHSTEV